MPEVTEIQEEPAEEEEKEVEEEETEITDKIPVEKVKTVKPKQKHLYDANELSSFKS
jgi:hypothetical protein